MVDKKTKIDRMIRVDQAGEYGRVGTTGQANRPGESVRAATTWAPHHRDSTGVAIVEDVAELGVSVEHLVTKVR